MGDIEVRFGIPNKGRGVFTLKSFQEGDVLFEEEPLVCSQFQWNALYKYAACEFCLSPLETAQEASRRLTGNAGLDLPHPECCVIEKQNHTSCPHCQVGYCSTTCRDKAWLQFHQTLCLGPSKTDPSHPLSKLEEAWRQVHYPPETSSIMLVAKMIATVKQAKDKDAVLQKLSDFCKTTTSGDQEITHKLLGERFTNQQEVLRSSLIEALYEDSVQQWYSPEGFQSLFALIGTNGQGIGSSSISRWVQGCERLELPEDEKAALDVFIDQLYEDLDRVSGHFLNCEGSGLYQLQSKCNHSCEPNAEVTFPHNNSTLAVRALSDIPPGQEVLISYLDECDRDRSRHSRQKLLKENYIFVCSCTKCLTQADDADVTSEEETDDENNMEEDDS